MLLMQIVTAVVIRRIPQSCTFQAHVFFGSQEDPHEAVSVTAHGAA